MSNPLDKSFGTIGDQPIYLNYESQGVDLSALRGALDMVVNIMEACRDEMDDFIEIGCGNGMYMYQGHFMLVKFGLEQAISLIGGVFPAMADNRPEQEGLQVGPK